MIDHFFKGTIAPEKYKTEVNIEVIPVTCTLELWSFFEIKDSQVELKLYLEAEKVTKMIREVSHHSY